MAAGDPLDLTLYFSMSPGFQSMWEWAVARAADELTHGTNWHAVVSCPFLWPPAILAGQDTKDVTWRAAVEAELGRRQ